MHSYRFAVLSAVTIVAALSLSGCSHHIESKPASPENPSSMNSGVNSGPHGGQSAQLPAPEALTDVLYRLADPTVRGTEKMALVQETTRDDAATMDRFAAALRDNGFSPLTCTATDIAWSDQHSGDVIATINITTTNPGKPGGFTFPMEFHPVGTGWQLSRETADMVLAFGNARTDASASAPVPTVPEPPVAAPPPEPSPSVPGR